MFAEDSQNPVRTRGFCLFVSFFAFFTFALLFCFIVLTTEQPRPFPCVSHLSLSFQIVQVPLCTQLYRNSVMQGLPMLYCCLQRKPSKTICLSNFS